MRARLLAGLLLVASLGCDAGRPLEVEAAFDTTARLDVGDEVRIADDVVGKITGMDWTEGSADPHVVHLRIEPEFRKRVTEDSTVRLEMDSYQEPVFYVRVIPGARGAAPAGHRFTGEVSLTARLAGAIRRTVDEVIAPGVRDVVEQFQRDLDDAVARGREEWERTRPEVERRLAELTLLAQSEKERLSAEGRAELDRLLTEYETLLDEHAQSQDRSP